jgi:hypothetical protein
MLAVFVAMAATAWSVQANADLAVGPGPPPPVIYLEITVNNTTSEPAKFVRSSSVCVSDSPESFTVDANARSTIKVTWDFSDGKVLCYSAAHNIGYEDKASSKNRFLIQQFASSNDWACLGLVIFYGYDLSNAICAEFHGSVDGPRTNPNPAKGLVYCPKDTPECPPHDNGGPNGPLAFGTEYWGFVIADPALAAPETVVAIEYFHAAFGHYFLTVAADEISKLDSGASAGWARTGQYFKAYPLGAAGAVDVCRFFTTSFAPRSSHFFTSFANECTTVRGNPNWQFEGTVFAVGLPDDAGNCAAGTQPLYRTYNNGQGGAPNHRYMTGLAVRSMMLGQGWIPEGSGSMGVIGCVPI